MVCVSFVLDVLVRAIDQELEAAPYPVFNTYSETKSVVAGIQKLDQMMFHFVSKGVNTWWDNSFVPHFLYSPFILLHTYMHVHAILLLPLYIFS